MSALELVKALIAFDTTSRGSNLALIEFAEGLIEQAGGRCRRSYDAGRIKANLFASFGPWKDGKECDGGIVLSGHTDVVPVDGQAWSSDPFKPETRQGKLYGRGACDMKGFIGVALSLLPEIARAPLKRPLHLALSYDEEVGCAGVVGLLEDLHAQNLKPALAIIGEPTLMGVVGAHKGGAKLVTRCHGREHHSSAPEKGANAVMMAGEFVALLGKVWDGLRADADPRFDPPHSTVQANVIGGGTAVNILAREAEVTWEYRCLPDRDPEAILETVEKRVQTEIVPKYRHRAIQAAMTTELQAQYPGLTMDEDSPAVRLARELTGANHVEAVAYGTEAGQFQRYGVPAVICGPGSIEQAHRADEFVALSELEVCEAFLRKVIARACT
ncbi:MAG TPA: acetylornithine deacetylase [Rhizomicrobium sp.]|jgi:acetylornithine deacetylase|nr:acetylornithine deacetylase [Rhizomicrobium sp.]